MLYSLATIYTFFSRMTFMLADIRSNSEAKSWLAYTLMLTPSDLPHVEASSLDITSAGPVPALFSVMESAPLPEASGSRTWPASSCSLIENKPLNKSAGKRKRYPSPLMMTKEQGFDVQVCPPLVITDTDERVNRDVNDVAPGNKRYRTYDRCS
jgi:hypothetical protein